jgi:hypothetical protein
MKSWQCQKCGENIGWLGRAIELLFNLHVCLPEPPTAPISENQDQGKGSE